MKLARKLILANFLGMVLVLAVNAWVRIGREYSLFEEDIKRDHAVMGRALGIALSEIWKDEGEARALHFMTRANEREADILIRWVWLDETGEEPLLPKLPRLRWQPALTGATTHWVDRDSTADGALTSYIPVTVGAGRPGAIEMSESLKQERHYTRVTLLHVLISTSILALVSGIIAVLLGYGLVGRRMRALADGLRRIGAGEPGVRVDAGHRDEIADLAQEMNHMTERLEAANERVAAETAARLAALEQLRHADRLTTVGKLASGIAHELGTPLNVVSARAKLIESAAEHGEEAAKASRVIREQVTRMTGTIRGLLDFARQRPPQRTRADLGGIARETVDLLGPLAKKRQIALTIDVPEGPSLANVDPGQVQQALTNLVMNAIQATSEPSTVDVRVHEAVAAPPSEVGSEPVRTWCIEVADRGTGIEPEHLGRIFEPFFTTKGVGEGTGLGLSVSYGIIREHGGWIAVESIPGSGSRFTIHLPVAEGVA